MSLLLRMGRGLQGFMGGGIGPKILQQTLTSSGTYTTTSGRDLSIILLGGGAPGTGAPTRAGGAVGNITFGTATFNSPFPYTIGGASGTTNFSPNLQATGGTGQTGGGVSGNPGTPGTSYPTAAPAPLELTTPSPVTINRGAGGGGNGSIQGQYQSPQPSVGLGGVGGGSGAHAGGPGGVSGYELAPNEGDYGPNRLIPEAGGSAGSNGGYGAGGGGGGVRNPNTNNPGTFPGGTGGPGIVYVYYGT